MLIFGLWWKHGLLLMLSDFYFQAQQGKIAAEDEEERLGKTVNMMLAKKVTAKALQKNGELLVLSQGLSPGLLVLEPLR